ncbi:hypothetical protein GGD46_004256 [Rhizobium lusitanum]|uniref:Uncharacterized protein n=1 Tax=Rhizobium lusitanum TaxID=293958 RepID=A0A7X0IUN6_9HYPH|nr:hypothetical protein [Rhizobium lusitanum]
MGHRLMEPNKVHQVTKGPISRGGWIDRGMMSELTETRKKVRPACLPPTMLIQGTSRILLPTMIEN